MPKTNAEYCRDYRKKRKGNKPKKIPKSSTERVREFRARRKALLNVKNNISYTCSNDFTVQNSENDHSIQRCNGLSSMEEVNVMIPTQSLMEQAKYMYVVPILHEVKERYSTTDHEPKICKDPLVMELSMVKEEPVNDELLSYKTMESNQIADHVANVKIVNSDVEVTGLKDVNVKEEMLTDDDVMNEQREAAEDVTVDIDEMKLEPLENTDGAQLQDGLSSLEDAKVKLSTQLSMEQTKYKYFVPILHEVKQGYSTTDHETEICKDPLVMELNMVKEEPVDDVLLSYKTMESNQIADHVANVKIENSDDELTGLKDVNVKEEMLSDEEYVMNEHDMKLEPLEDTYGAQLQGTHAIIQGETDTVMPEPKDKRIEEERRYSELRKTEKGKRVSNVYSEEASLEIQDVDKSEYSGIKKIDSMESFGPDNVSDCDDLCFFRTIVNDSGIAHECTICKYMYNGEGNLKRHLRTHTSEKRFECTVCECRFNGSGQLKRHIRTHTGEKPYECTVCKNKFNESGKLKIHLRIHSGKKPFECTICGYRCNLKSEMTTHLRTHTGEKPFECTICTYRCNRKSDLREHLGTHASAKPRVNNKKKERQQRYREQNREKLKQREAERRKRIQYLQTVTAPSTSSKINKILNNEEIIDANSQSSSGFEGTLTTSIQRNEQTIENNALQKNRQRQQRYREQNREKLKRREAERRQRIQYLQTVAALSTSPNINKIELNNEEIIDANSQSSSGFEGTLTTSIQRNEQTIENNALQKYRQRQQRYREQNGEKLKRREAERRQRIQYLQTVAALSTSPNINKIELNNEEIIDANSQSSSGFEGTQISSIQRNEQTIENNALQKKRNRQQRYREQNREKLKRREAERRKRIQYLQSVAGTSTSSNINRIELNNEEIIDANSQSSSGFEGTQTSSIQKNEQTKKNDALQKRRQRQQRYRERNREKLKRREAERRQRLQNSCG